MKKILCKVMKNKVIILIKIIGFGLNEILLSFPLTIADFDSIEWDDETDKVYLHILKDDDYDVVVDFDELTEEDQLQVYKILSVIYN